MKIPKITQSELYQELDRFRPSTTPEFTIDIYKYIEYARKEPCPVYWKDICISLKKNFNIEIELNTLRNRYFTWKAKIS